jgi:RimJ/RimL family protein N-acetyltransferase
LRLETERLILHPFEPDDAEDLHAAHSDPSTFAYLGLQILEDGPEVELGYKLGPEYRGRGYATEAGRAWLAYGFETLGLDRIVAVAWPENAASWRVMEKLGMTRVGPGHHYGHETLLYRITREEFETRAG